MKRSLVNTALSAVMSAGLILPAVAQTYNGQQLQGRVTYVPIGTQIDATLASPIDSAVAKPGDIFNAKLSSPLYLGNDLVLPASTMLEGQITAADKGGHAGINGTVGMRLTAAITPDGVRFPLSAMLIQNSDVKALHEDKQGNLHGRTKSSTVKSAAVRTAAWTGAGTLLGIIFAPIVAGSVAAGAVAGVATGGAVGLGSNLWRKGKDVRVPSGTPVKFALDQPMSLSTGIAGTGGYR